MALVLVVAREAGVLAGLGRQVRGCRCDGLESGLLVVGDDRHCLAWLLRCRCRLFDDRNLAVNAQHFCHLVLERGITAFQVVAHLCGFTSCRLLTSVIVLTAGDQF